MSARVSLMLLWVWAWAWGAAGQEAYYFAATAVDAAGLESDYSGEVCWTNPGGVSSVTLAWGASTSAGITNYNLYAGVASSAYLAVYVAGTNLSIAIPMAGGEASGTNLVILLSASCTNWPALELTNPCNARAVFRSDATPAGSRYRVQAETADGPLGPWSVFTNWPAFTNAVMPRISLSIEAVWR